tara:strand:- start:17 stop:160 length:144 start_codon:yes stop_codon:yes gene_type:complete
MQILTIVFVEEVVEDLEVDMELLLDRQTLEVVEVEVPIILEDQVVLL